MKQTKTKYSTISYFLFPFDLQGKELYMTRPRKNEIIKSIEKNATVKLSKVDFVTEDVFVVYNPYMGLKEKFIKQVVKDWLKYECNIPGHDRICSVGELIDIVSKMDNCSPIVYRE